jgi:hypothetical protein
MSENNLNGTLFAILVARVQDLLGADEIPDSNLRSARIT